MFIFKFWLLLCIICDLAANSIFREHSLGLSPYSDVENPQNVFYKLNSFVGYYGFHYMAFILTDEIWHLWEDAKIKAIGNFTELLEYIEKCKIIPYLIFYERLFRVRISENKAI